MAQVDDNIQSEFEMLSRRAEDQTLDEQTRRQYTNATLPMLMAVRRSSFQFESSGYKEWFRIDSLIACTATKVAFGELLRRSDVVAIEMSRNIGHSECSVSVPSVNVGPVHRNRPPGLAELGDRALVGIVDDSIDVSHWAFDEEYSGISRLLAIWDQQAMRGQREVVPEIRTGR